MRKLVGFFIVWSFLFSMAGAYEYDLYYIETSTKAAAPNVLFLFDISGSMASSDVCLPATDFKDELYCVDLDTASDYKYGSNPSSENWLSSDFTNGQQISSTLTTCDNPDVFSQSNETYDEDLSYYSLAYDMCPKYQERLKTLKDAISEVVLEL